MGRSSKPNRKTTAKTDMKGLGFVSFFDIPVYRISQEAYDEEFKDYVAKLEEGYDSSTRKIITRDRAGNTQEHRRRLDTLKRCFGGIWRFNEIVGYVGLHFVGDQVRGVLFFVNKKRVFRTRTKKMVWVTHKVAPELSLPRNGKNADIYQTILEYLDRVRKALPLRYLDTSVFERVGPYVDWKALRGE